MGDHIMINKISKIIKVIVMLLIPLNLIMGKSFITFILLLVLILLLITDYLKNKLGFSDLTYMLIYIFVISSEILGEVFSFYNKISYFDIIMHTLSGFVAATISVYLLKKLNKSSSRNLILIFSFLFAMTSAAIWEITEFTIDRIFHQDMQKDTIIQSITSNIFSPNNDEPITKNIEHATINNIDLTKMYGGYIDIGLYDTIEDIIAASFGSIVFIFITLKRKTII